MWVRQTVERCACVYMPTRESVCENSYFDCWFYALCSGQTMCTEPLNWRQSPVLSDATNTKTLRANDICTQKRVVVQFVWIALAENCQRIDELPAKEKYFQETEFIWRSISVNKRAPITWMTFKIASKPTLKWIATSLIFPANKSFEILISRHLPRIGPETIGENRRLVWKPEYIGESRRPSCLLIFKLVPPGTLNSHTR